ncbi:MAG: hypothetical protein LBN29_12020 [Mediterranea sp.]|nr:hypothetical protein [Mediterranea sp.]
MKGLVLEIGGQRFVGRETDFPGLIITNKEDPEEYRVLFSGMNADSSVFYHWYGQPLEEGEVLRISYQEIGEAESSTPISIRDTRDKEQEKRLILENYYRLKEKLTKEGKI